MDTFEGVAVRGMTVECTQICTEESTYMCQCLRDAVVGRVVCML